VFPSLRLLAFVLALFPIAASAQGRSPGRGSGHRLDPSQLAAELRQASAAAALAARQERGLARLGAELDRLAQLADALSQQLRGREPWVDALRPLSTQYRITRDVLHGARRRPSDAFLDTWDELVFAERRLERRFERSPAPGPVAGPPPPPPPPRAAPSLVFEGSFEQTPVRFVGTSAAEIHGQCVSFMGAARIGQIDDINIFGAPFRNQPSYWDPDALCSIAVLNTRIAGRPGPSLNGTAEDVPFSVPGDPETVRATILTYLPRALRGAQIDDLVIEGRRMRNQAGYWSGQEVAQLVASSIAARPQAPPPGVVVRAQGSIGGLAFAFAAPSAEEIRAQCTSFVRAYVRRGVNAIEVDGQLRRRSSGFWREAEICTIISAAAR